MRATIPSPELVTPDTPLLLRIAAAIAYPDGSVSGKDLLREFRKGRLMIERTADKNFTTLRNIDEMRSMFFGAQGNIYFIGYGSFVKIGFTKRDVQKRINGLSIGSPETLIIYAVKRGLFDEEKVLHQRFAEYWIRGEWFRREGALLDYIASLEPPK